MAADNHISDQDLMDLLNACVKTDGGENTLAGLRANPPESVIRDGILYLTERGDFYSVPINLDKLRAGIITLSQA